MIAQCRAAKVDNYDKIPVLPRKSPKLEPRRRKQVIRPLRIVGIFVFLVAGCGDYRTGTPTIKEMPPKVTKQPDVKATADVALELQQMRADVALKLQKMPKQAAKKAAVQADAAMKPQQMPQQATLGKEASMRANGPVVRCLAFSPDGSLLASGGGGYEGSKLIGIVKLADKRS